MATPSAQFIGFVGGAPGGFEILLILVVVLLLFGTKNLPTIARNLGRTLEEFRRAARDVTDEIMSEPEDRPKPAAKQIAADQEEESTPESDTSGKEDDDRPA